MSQALVVRQNKVVSKCCYDNVTCCKCNSTNNKNDKNDSQINYTLNKCSINENRKFLTTQITDESSVVSSR